MGMADRRLEPGRSGREDPGRITGPAPDLPGPAAPGADARSRLGAYIALTKPRIIELSLVTAVPTLVGPLYLGSPIVLGGVSTGLAARLLSEHSPKAAMRTGA